jgi:hypothetical protein
MSDSEYQRVVDELKQRKRGGTDESNDLWRLMRCNGAYFTQMIGWKARRYNGYRDEGPYADALVRANALFPRIDALSPWQAAGLDEDIPRRACMRLHRMSAPTPDDFDRALAEIQATVELAEMRSAS